jgi:hypothetical protein
MWRALQPPWYTTVTKTGRIAFERAIPVSPENQEAAVAAFFAGVIGPADTAECAECHRLAVEAMSRLCVTTGDEGRRRCVAAAPRGVGCINLIRFGRQDAA